MLQIFGSWKEKLGKPIDRIWFLIPIGKGHYRKIGARYFGEKDEKVKFEGYHYLCHPERAVIENGQTHIQFIVHDASELQTNLNFNGAIIDGLSPKQLDNLVYDGHVKTALRNAASGNMGILMMVLAIGIGLAVGFLLGQNISLKPAEEAPKMIALALMR